MRNSMIQQAGRARALVMSLATVVMLLPGLASAASPGIAYSVRSRVDQNLYSIDLASGALTRIGPTGFKDVEGLTFDPNGVLYGYDSFTEQLLKFDLATGAAVAVGRTGLSTRGVGLSFDDRGNLYMSNVYPRVIYKLDPRTAAATAVGAQCQCVCGLAFDHGVMYGLGGDHSNNLVQVERSCGAITAIGPLQNVSLEIGGIDFDRHGVLWGIEQEGKLFTVNTASGVATVAASFGRGFKGIAIPPDRAPDCSRAVPSLETLWPPDHGLIGIDVLGVTDPDGDPVTLTIDRITQDEPVADGGTCPDAAITGSTAQLRAERSANGDGRIYLVSFTADDGLGGVSTGRVAVMVPHDQGKKSCTDTGLIYNSLESCSAALQGRAGDAASTAVRTIASAGSGATLEYSLAAEAEMQLAVYDVMGRRVAVVESGARSAGTHRATWNASGLPSGMYFAVLRAGDHVVRTPVILLK